MSFARNARISASAGEGYGAAEIRQPVYPGRGFLVRPLRAAACRTRPRGEPVVENLCIKPGIVIGRLRSALISPCPTTMFARVRTFSYRSNPKQVYVGAAQFLRTIWKRRASE